MRVGIRAGVINLRFLNPMDTDMIIAQAKLTGRLITVEDHTLMAGMGSAVAEVLADEGLEGVRLGRLGYRDFIQHGSTEMLMREAGVSVDSVVQMARAMCKEKRSNAVG
jgi:1-deoxy-D-xylulose-5-phosphate synthase